MAKEGSILLVAGTRPEAIKIAPIIWWLDRLKLDYVFLWSGQHYDYEMSRVFFDQLRLPEPEEFLEVGSQARNMEEQVAQLIQKIAEIIKRQTPKFVYALGDTNTTLASALASAYLTKPFIHDEAGMRSFDNSMIEEINRKTADAIANFRFAPTKIAVLNLLYEGASPSTIKLVGSTVVDTLLYAISNNLLKEETLNTYDVEPSHYILFTIHRRENLIDESLISIVSLILKVASKLADYKIIFPIHPHTRKILEEKKLINQFSSHDNIMLIKPLGYFDFITLMKNASLVVTDSGGVQEEAFILGKKTLTLRSITEWPETTILGYNFLVNPRDINRMIDVLIKLVELPESKPPQLSTNPLGDGNSGQRIAKLLQMLSGKKIERGLEVSGYPLPYFTKKADRFKLCFKDKLPIVYATNKDLDPNLYCIERKNLANEEMMRIIEIDWKKIDEFLWEE